MVNLFITPVISEASRLGVSLFEETDPIRLWIGASELEAETVSRAVYRQVLGNAYVMESERLMIAESHLKSGEISVSDFVRAVAYSNLYRARFFENCPRYRAIELNFKHLLGRTPDSYEEMLYHSHLLDVYGFEAEIDSYIDSDEYQDTFGDDTVPFYRGYKTQTGKKIVGFTYMFQLLRGASSSDKTNFLSNSSRLNQLIIANKPSAVVPPSSVSSYGGITDVKKLLADVLQPKSQQPAVDANSWARQQAYQSLFRRCEEQASEIASLQKKLADLKPVASITEAYLNKWNSYSPSTPSTTGITAEVLPPKDLEVPKGHAASYESLLRLSEEQEKAIASLQQQLAELKSLANIGEAWLNKWRSRMFSS